ncbi:hypothetical protein QUB06_15200 [Microcoleus sp. D2_18a_D3]
MKKEEITRYIWLGAVVVKRDFRFVMFFSVEAEPLDMRYRAEPGNEPKLRKTRKLLENCLVFLSPRGIIDDTNKY